MMKNNIYITIVPEIIKEGGMARNKAFLNFLKLRRDLKIINLNYTGSFFRFYKTIQLIYILLISNKKKIFVHETVLVSLFPLKLFKYSFFKFFFDNIMMFSDKRNLFFLEINDLPFEQAIDLELEHHQGQLGFQKSIFSLKNSQYAFASHLMNEYAKDKYKITNYCETIVNAGPELNSILSREENEVKEQLDKNKVSFVYSGTLNKGRQIEKLLEVFSRNKSLQLFLLGADGDWLENENLENVFYLGNYEEDTAHRIVSLFDIGLVPYDNNRFYYNICYPTKVSFYLTAGLPVICTPLKEMRYWFSDKNYLIFENIENWSDFFLSVDRIFLNHIKKELKSENYTWNHILNNSGINKFFDESSNTFSHL